MRGSSPRMTLWWCSVRSRLCGAPLKKRCTASGTRDQFVFFASPSVSITLRSESVSSTTNFL
jgi:hypothetical protein